MWGQKYQNYQNMAKIGQFWPYFDNFDIFGPTCFEKKNFPPKIAIKSPNTLIVDEKN